MWKNIIDELTTLKEMVESWQKETVVPEIERDLALRKMRTLYESVKFGVEKLPPTTVYRESPQEELKERVEEQALEGDDESIEPALVEEFNLEAVAPEQTVERDLHFVKSRRDTIIESIYGVELTDKEKEVLGEEEFDKLTQSDVYEIEKIERSEIVSEDEYVFRAENLAQGQEEADVDDAEDNRTKEVGTKSEHQQQATKLVLGDVIHTHERTLGDSYAEIGHGEDLGTRLGVDKAHSGLRKSIGINDRYLMTKELFDGDGPAFDAAISTIEQFTELDDALIHIHETYSWNPNNEAVKLLVDLLSKKLS